ncbi:MAG TPA: metalloregulator ArsR/SmtB family transcription factor [Catalimonadaceae bacterium]|nr:metalloregulator ArsR/SmtB family transcription factor [Catalimonadaceae bacterium]
MSLLTNPNEAEKFSTIKLKTFSLSFGAQLFKALGDSSRLRILHLLYSQPDLSISDIEVILDFTQTKVARLVILLKNAGLVQSRRREQWVLYQIKDEASELIGYVMDFLQKDPELQDDLANCQNMASNRELSRIKLNERFYKSQY